VRIGAEFRTATSWSQGDPKGETELTAEERLSAIFGRRPGVRDTSLKVPHGEKARSWPSSVHASGDELSRGQTARPRLRGQKRKITVGDKMAGATETRV